MDPDSMKKPLLLFDGDCGFCWKWILRLKLFLGNRLRVSPYQKEATAFPDIREEEFQKSVHFFSSDGQHFRAAHAVFQALALRKRSSVFLMLYERVSWFRRISEFCYQQVAEKRECFSKMERVFTGLKKEIATYDISSRFFLKGMGGVYILAFVSLWFQIEGLIGSNGIVPVQDYLRAVYLAKGGEGMLQVPTILWVNSGDWMLHGICAMGVLLGALSLWMGKGGRGWVFFLLWFLYLSLVSVGDVFLRFQWDALLLETGFLTILFASSWLGSQWGREKEDKNRGFQPSGLVRWLLYWLLFRLMFASGIVKLTYEDVSWWDLTALTFHYETQPLPMWIGWYVSHLPKEWHQLSAGIMFFIELILPFLIFGPRRLKLISCGGLILLQVLIMATGNYGFFNLLTILLCLLLIDDQTWRKLKKIGMKCWGASQKEETVEEWKDDAMAVQRSSGGWFILVPVTGVILMASSLDLLFAINPRLRWSDVVRSSGLPEKMMEQVAVGYGTIKSFSVVNSYGLFRVMTKTRLEITVQGSEDGVTWKDYGFKWKPGDPKKAPAMVQPHMPRLDWQMWFAALGKYNQRQNQWFIRFLVKLLEGKPEVLELMDKNPFPKNPPKYIRAIQSQYSYTTIEEKRKSGKWWEIKERGLYCPSFSLREVRR